MMLRPKTAPVQIVVGALLGANLLLSGALAWLALHPRPVVLVPGVRESEIALPEEIPPSALQKFARLYLVLFDDYTPETIEDRSNYLLRLVAPEAQEKVRRDLQERATYVVRTRESSHLQLPLPELGEVERLPGGLFRVTLVAQRQVYIASEEKTRSRIRYALTVRPAFPSDQDAFGFVIVGQTLEPETREASISGKGDRRD